MSTAVIDQHRPSTPQLTWREALKFGSLVALTHRLLLTIWLAVSVLLGMRTGHYIVDIHIVTGPLPELNTFAEQLLLGVWRRWDGLHYLNLAANGYRAEDPMPTVFGMLTPWLIRAADRVLPGSLEVGAIAVETFAVAAAMTLLYRLVGQVYGDRDLARWSVLVLALHPLSHYLAAPMTDALYLAFCLAYFMALLDEKWWLVGVFGLLAALTRHQGVLLLVPAAIVVLKQQLDQKRIVVRDLLTRSPAFVLPPLGYLAFVMFRQVRGLAPLGTVLETYYLVSFVDPVTGLLTNLRTFVTDPLMAVLNVNILAVPVSIGLLAVSIIRPAHRHWPFIGYTISHLVLFVSKLSAYPGNTVVYTESMARYTLALFPLIVITADWLRGRGKWLRLAAVAFLLVWLLMYSALYAMGYGPF